MIKIRKKKKIAFELHARAWVKSVIWIILGIAVLGIISWFATHRWKDWLTINLSLGDLILLIGLFFNIVGTFLIAFSIKFLNKICIGYDDDGKRAYVEGYFPIYKKCLFYWGIYTLFTGFIFQLISIFFS